MSKRKININIHDREYWRAGHNPIDRLLQNFLARALGLIVVLMLLRAILGGLV